MIDSSSRDKQGPANCHVSNRRSAKLPESEDHMPVMLTDTLCGMCLSKVSEIAMYPNRDIDYYTVEESHAAAST
jgi:hypothetical protein